MSDPKLRLGIAGLGRAFQLMLPSFKADPRIALIAGADPREAVRDIFAREFSAPAYETVEALCADPKVDAVYIATPHQYHAAHATMAAAHGKHVLVEKPMALNLADCAAMVEAARKAGVHLVIGHSHSFDRPIARVREIIASGEIGAVRMITAMNFTDFLYRPRRPEELDTAQGGGVFFNQAPHQIDIVRLLGGGQVRSVRAGAGAWDRSRPTEGAYGAFLTFADGALATVSYSGYAHFDSDEWCDNIGEGGRPKDLAQYGGARRLLAGFGDAQAETAARHRRGDASISSSADFHEHFGVVIVSCEHADLRPTPKGVMIYGDGEKRFEALPPPAVPRGAVIDELCAAVFAGKSPLHDGAWGLATMEACLAMLQSAQEDREILLQHQIGVPARA